MSGGDQTSQLSASAAFEALFDPETSERLLAQLRSEGQGPAVAAERARIKECFQVGAILPGNEALVHRFAFEQPGSPDDLAKAILAQPNARAGAQA